MPLQYNCISSLLEEQQRLEAPIEEPHTKAVYKGEFPIRVANITYPDLSPLMGDLGSPNILPTTRAPHTGENLHYDLGGFKSEFAELIGQFPKPPIYNAYSAPCTRPIVRGSDITRSFDSLPPNPAFDVSLTNAQPCNHVPKSGSRHMQPVPTANVHRAYSTSHTNASVPNLGYGRTGARLGQPRTHIPVSCLPYGVASKSNVSVNNVGSGNHGDSLSGDHRGKPPTRNPRGTVPRPTIPVNGPSIDIRSRAVKPSSVDNPPIMPMCDANGNYFTNVNDVYRAAVSKNKPHVQEQRPIVHGPSESNKHRSVHAELEFSSLYAPASEVAKHGAFPLDVRGAVPGKQDSKFRVSDPWLFTSANLCCR